jgi:hypothetical protein
MKAICSCVFGSVVFVACASSSSLREIGDACDRDGQCASGLSCRANFVGGECTSKTCTVVCTELRDCQAVNPKARCFKGCGDESICMLTP